MGHPEATITILPGQNRRTERARRAKDTVSRIIPDILRESPRARHGIHRAELVVDPSALDAGSHADSDTHPKVRVQCADTLTAAARLSERPFARNKTDTARPNVGILNMASSLRPGGGFLDGANSQEEFLCARTTLYASLWDSFYPLPESGGIYTPNVMVFRDNTPEAKDLNKRERFFVDVISAGMLRFPDSQRARYEQRTDSPPCSCGVSYCDRDRDRVTRKMKAVLRMAQQHGVERLVLGAWGCGAYGNPVKEVAKLWRKVIAGGPRQRRPNAEQWEGIRDITFAIPERAMARAFEAAFSDVLSYDAPSPVGEAEADGNDTRTSSRSSAALATEDQQIEELIARIAETEMQMEQTINPRSKAHLRETLGNLNRDLTRGLAARQFKEDELTQSQDEQLQADGQMGGGTGSDGEDNNFYNFDEDDVASDSSDGAASEIYDFRTRSRSISAASYLSYDPEELEMQDLYAVLPPSPSFDAQTGWYTGSIDQFHKYVRGADSRAGSRASPKVSEPREGASGLGFEEERLQQYLQQYAGETEGASA